MHGTHPPSLWTLAELRFGTAVGLEFAATAVCRHLTTGAAGIVLGTVVVGGAFLLPWRYAGGLAVTAWAFLTGFVVNTGGQLSFGPDDARHLVDLAAAAVLVSCAVAIARIGAWSTHSQPHRRIPAAHGAYLGTRTSSRPWMHSMRSSLPGPIESPSSWRGVSTAARTTTVWPVIRLTRSSVRGRRASTR
jgi:hypothetical protein